MSTSISRDIEDLAAEIGKQVYIDVAKWHLYLADANLHIPLAEKLYTILKANDLSEAKVQAVLASIPVKLGGGQKELPLSDLVPTPSQTSLMEVLENFQRKM
jgi:hypothetical protein